MTSPAPTRPEDPVTRRSARERRATRIAEAASGGIRVLITKIVLLAFVDAIGVYLLFILLLQRSWPVFALVAAATIAVNVIYFRKGLLPAKYLTPGLVFLLIFQIFVVLYTGYISFTNYGSGHNSTKSDAITALIQSAQTRVPGSSSYRLTVLEKQGGLTGGDDLRFLVTGPKGAVQVGGDDTPLHAVSDAKMSDGRAVGLPGYTSLNFSQILDRQGDITGMRVPISNDPNDGVLRTSDGRTAYLYTSTLKYDESADTMTDTKTGVVYSDTGQGAFTSPSGKQLLPGWRINVGFGNYVRAVTNSAIRGPLIGVTVWTFVFAVLSVATTFVLGLFLAIVFNDARMRGRRWYRAAMILPYAFPGFLSALVWAGMMNSQFGFINQVLLGGADVPWLTNAFLAKVSILLVNLWLGFPYMFLVCTGALQAIPDEMQEAARVDGASSWAIFRRIKFPLLLVSVAPLLISSFAFNFNNFNLIYMLTGGGPNDVNADINVGGTDILISMVYKIAFVGADRDYGLASAFSIIIFIIVGVVSAIGFRQTKALEELN